MFGKKGICVSNDLKVTAFPIFLLCKIFGTIPVSISHFESSLVVEFSILKTIYSYIVGLISVGLAVNGVIEAVTHIGINESTTKYVIVMNMIIVQVTIIIGIFGAPFRFSNLYNFIKFISEIDAIVPPLNTKRERNASIRVMILTLLTAIISSGTKIYTMYTYSEGNWFAIIRDTLFYCIVMILECQYWYMTSMVQRRIYLLNQLLLSDILCNNDKLKWHNTKFGNEIEAGTATVSDKQNQQTKVLDDNIDFPFHRTTMNNENNNNNRKAIVCKFATAEHGWKLIKVYTNLCNVVDNLNDCCGLFVSIIVVIDLLQLTVGGYFLIIELQSNFDIYYTILLSLMFLVYFYRLVFIVEPCENSLKQVKQTNGLVCKLLCLDIEDSYKIQMKVLYDQLLQRKMEFSAYGLGNIDRSIITTILANVTVYLVAVLQFKISEH